VETTPLYVSSYTHLLYKVQDPFHFSSTIWTISLRFTDQETQEKNLLGGTNSFVGQFLHPSLVQSSRSIPLFFYNLDDKSCFIDQETQEENLLGGTNPFVCQFLHPSLVQSSRSIPLFFYNLDDKSSFHRSRNSGREFVRWNQLLCRSVLTPISCTRFKIHSTFHVQFGR